jgi:hypothetical protein
VPIETDNDETLLLPASLRAEFKDGFLFTITDGVIYPGWREDNAQRNYRVEWADLATDGRSGRASYMSETSIVYWKAQDDKREQLARQRARFVKQVRAEQGPVLPEVLAAANKVLEEHRGRLSDEGVAVLQAYIARLPGRFRTAAADQMRDGASLADTLAETVVYLAGQTKNRAGALLGLRRYRRGATSGKVAL